MAELVDATDLGSVAARRGGSSPFIRTTYFLSLIQGQHCPPDAGESGTARTKSSQCLPNGKALWPTFDAFLALSESLAKTKIRKLEGRLNYVSESEGLC